MDNYKNRERSARQLRFGENLRKAISLVLQNYSFHDPIIDDSTLIITEVRVSPDLSNASVYIIIMGNSGNNQELVSTINDKFRKLVGPLTRELKLRRAPKIKFIYDDSIERQSQIDKLIEKAKNNNFSS